MSNLTDLVPAGGAGKVVKFTASGSITNGKPVVINSNGTVNQVNSDLSSTNFIGIANESVSSGATVKVMLQGGVDNTQSGLTPGSTYYVRNDATISTSADSPSIICGLAISTTTILLAGE
jgi:hypothetical protein